MCMSNYFSAITMNAIVANIRIRFLRINYSFSPSVVFITQRHVCLLVTGHHCHVNTWTDTLSALPVARGCYVSVFTATSTVTIYDKNRSLWLWTDRRKKRYSWWILFLCWHVIQKHLQLVKNIITKSPFPLNFFSKQLILSNKLPKKVSMILTSCFVNYSSI